LSVHAALGDQQAALLGLGLEPGELSVNVATGSQVSDLVETMPLGDVQVRPYPGRRWLRTVTHLPAGRSLNALLRLLTDLTEVGGGEADALGAHPAWTRAMAAAERIETTDLDVDLAFFPCATGHRGGISNAHEGNLTPGHVMRASLEAMARNYRWAAERLAAASPAPADIASTWRHIAFSGGLAVKSETLRRVTSRLLGLPYRLGSESEDALAGVLQHARKVLGIIA